jgi:hypothetical protein
VKSISTRRNYLFNYNRIFAQTDWQIPQVQLCQLPIQITKASFCHAKEWVNYRSSLATSSSGTNLISTLDGKAITNDGNDNGVGLLPQWLSLGGQPLLTHGTLASSSLHSLQWMGQLLLNTRETLAKNSNFPLSNKSP